MFYQFALIGYPVAHSLSPWIHETFLSHLGWQGKYDLLEVPPETSLKNTLNELKEKNYIGINVTVPYKEKIIPYLDEIDINARAMGAVNTVCYEDGKWVGYNTDGLGFIQAIEYVRPTFGLNSLVKVLLIGAGGAARGIYAALQSKSFHCIDIANRTKENAERMASLYAEKGNTTVYTLLEAEERLHVYDLIIQTTDVGMTPKQNESVLSLRNLKQDSIVSDIVYQPIKTTFLEEAEKQGSTIVPGHLMLLFQAQKAFEIWTNHLPPIKTMDTQLKQILEGR